MMFRSEGVRGLARTCVLMAAAGVGSFAFAVPSDGGHLMMDGLVFDLMARAPAAETGRLATSDIKNRLDWSAATPFGWQWLSDCTDASSIAEHGVPEPLAVEDLEVTSAPYPHVTNTYSCLRFPQPVRTVVSDDLATTNYYQFPTAVVSQKPVETGPDMTVFVKFRWAGNLPHPTVQNWVGVLAANAQDDGGFGLGVLMPRTTESVDIGYLTFSAAGDDFNKFDYGLAFTTNKWFAVAVVVKARADGGSEVTAYSPTGSPAIFRELSYTIADKQIRYPHTTAWRDNLSLGASASVHGNVGQPTKWHAFGNWGQFRGDIAKFQVYDRALSREEVYMLCADANASGGGFRIGSANGRADEFAAADDATRADVYEPRTMPPDRMLKGLDAQNPSLTIRFPLPEAEDGLAKVLVVQALPEDVGAFAPVDVLVNGTRAATLNLCQTNRYAAFLRKRFMKRDTDGNVTLTLARQGTGAGTIRFDSLELAGAWRAGRLDGVVDADVFAPSRLVQHSDYAGWGCGYQVVGGGGGVRYLMDALFGLRLDKRANYYPSTQIIFNVPEEIASTCKSQLSLRLANGAASDVAEISLWLNGAERLHRKGLDRQQALTVDLTPGELNPGGNVLVVSNATCDFETAASTEYAYALRPDSLSWDFRPPPIEGLMMVVR